MIIFVIIILRSNCSCKDKITLNSLMNESTFEFTNRLFKDEFKKVYEFNNSSLVNELTFKKLYKLLNALSFHYSSNGNLQFIDKNQYGKNILKKIISFLRSLIHQILWIRI